MHLAAAQQSVLSEAPRFQDLLHVVIVVAKRKIDLVVSPNELHEIALLRWETHTGRTDGVAGEHVCVLGKHHCVGAYAAL